MKVIGKIDGLPVFEVDRGKYIVVNVEDEKCYTTWSWFSNLGRWSDTFEKCDEVPEEMACLDLIEKDMSKILEKLNSYDDELESEDGKKMLEEQDKFYDWLDDGREYNWFDGYTDEEEE